MRLEASSVCESGLLRALGDEIGETVSLERMGWAPAVRVGCSQKRCCDVWIATTAVAVDGTSTVPDAFKRQGSMLPCLRGNDES